MLGWIWCHTIIRKGQGPRIRDKKSNRVSEQDASAAPSARLSSWPRKVPGPARARVLGFVTQNPGACLSQSRGPAQGSCTMTLSLAGVTINNFQFGCSDDAREPSRRCRRAGCTDPRRCKGSPRSALSDDNQGNHTSNVTTTTTARAQPSCRSR